MNPLEKVLGNHIPFLEKLLSCIATDGIDVSSYEMDHICYRVETLERYHELKHVVGQHGELLSEIEIAGRPISTYKLRVPFVFKERKVYCLELPAPKLEQTYPEGFEHAEFVIDKEFEEFRTMHPTVPFTISRMKSVNPEMNRKYDGVAVKFHRHSLEYVITVLEK